MRAAGYSLGGEQSGHIVLGTHSTTGDGTVAALQVLAELVLSARPASETLRVFEPCPQALRNVRLADKATANHMLQAEPVTAAVAGWRDRLGSSGRILLRKSGTEPLIRVMVEAEDERLVEAIVSDLCCIIEGASPLAIAA